MFSFLLFFSLSATEARRPKIVADVASKNGVGCDVCTVLVSLIEEGLKSQKTEEEIAKIVSSYCSVLGETLKPLCETLTTQYIPIIMQWLEQEMEHLEICTKLGFCEEATISYMPRSVALTAGGCEMCTKVVTTIENLLKNGYVEKEIATAVATLCQTFPQPVSGLCTIIVERYVPIIIQWIESGMEHFNICSKLGFCDNSLVLAPVARIPDNGITCSMCKMVVGQIERCLLDEKVEGEIRDILAGLCTKYFPDPYATICVNFVNQYTAEIMQLIEQGVSKLGICEKLGYCSSNGVVAPRMPPPNGLTCSLCKTIVSAVERAMVSTKVESEIIEKVQKICTKIQAPYSTLCESIVAQYVPQIMQWLEQGLEHADICKKLNICPQEATMFLGARIPKEIQNGVTCDICKEFFRWVKIELEAETVDKLWYLVNTECPKVPYLKYFCQLINEDNINTIVNLILSNVDFTQACQWIQVC